MKLLVVDDNCSLGHHLAEVIEQRTGAKCDAMTNPSRAVDRCQEYDGIILDDLMPVLSGLAAAERMRQARYLGHLLLYATLDNKDEILIWRAHEAGMIVLQRTERHDQLIAAVKVWMETRSTEIQFTP